MSRKNSVYKVASALLFTLMLGSTAAHAESVKCVKAQNLATDLASGKLARSGWQTDVRHISNPTLTQVQLVPDMSHATGGTVNCEYVQKNHSGNDETFVVKRIASTDFPADVVKQNEWSPIQNGMKVCSPTRTNKCQFTASNSLSVASLENDARCESMRREIITTLERLAIDRQDPRLKERHYTLTLNYARYCSAG